MCSAVCMPSVRWATVMCCLLEASLKLKLSYHLSVFYIAVNMVFHKLTELHWTQLQTTFFLCNQLNSAEDSGLFLYKWEAYFSQLLSTNVSKFVLVRILLCWDNPSTSQVWHNMLMRQQDCCTGVPKAGNNKRTPTMCSFTEVLGVGKSVSMWCDHHLPHAV